MLSNEEDEKKTVKPEETNDTILELQLGDVIQIFNPVNENLDDKMFIIDYIDNSKAYLINKLSLNYILY